MAIVFSADHGGLDFAGRPQDQGMPARRLDTAAWMKELQSRVRRELHLDQDLLIAGNDHFPNELYCEPGVARQLGDRKEWVAKLVNIVRAMPDIAAPDRAGEILFAYQPMIDLGVPPDHDPAQHGTAHDYDRRVPIMFWGSWRAERRLDPVSTVDIAPTLAKELGMSWKSIWTGCPQAVT